MFVTIPDKDKLYKKALYMITKDKKFLIRNYKILSPVNRTYPLP